MTAVQKFQRGETKGEKKGREVRAEKTGVDDVDSCLNQGNVFNVIK